MKLKAYLLQYHTEQTASSYEREIINYMSKVGVENSRTAKYIDIMDYVGYLRSKYDNAKTIKRIIQSIKRYYAYLVVRGIREDNPAKFLYLKDKMSNDVQLQDLFKREDLELLLEVKERYNRLNNRNRLIVSLLIYQGLHSDEIVNLSKEDFDLEKGLISLKGTNRINKRTLKLKPNQILLCWKYIYEDLPKLKAKEGSLFVGMKGDSIGVSGVGYLLERAKYLFPDRNLTAVSVRQSVITNLLKEGKDLRLVQVFAGHKYISSTERYRQKGIEELKVQVQKYHPLG